jgi:hypothetical protein
MYIINRYGEIYRFETRDAAVAYAYSLANSHQGAITVYGPNGYSYKATPDSWRREWRR